MGLSRHPAAGAGLCLHGPLLWSRVGVLDVTRKLIGAGEPVEALEVVWTRCCAAGFACGLSLRLAGSHLFMRYLLPAAAPDRRVGGSS